MPSGDLFIPGEKKKKQQKTLKIYIISVGFFFLPLCVRFKTSAFLAGWTKLIYFSRMISEKCSVLNVSLLMSSRLDKDVLLLQQTIYLKYFNSFLQEFYITGLTAWRIVYIWTSLIASDTGTHSSQTDWQILHMGEVLPIHLLQIPSSIISRICICALMKVKYRYINGKLLYP